MTQLETLTTQECWDRLGSGRVGRIGFDRGRGPRIHPIAYTVRDGELWVSTSRSSELGMFAAMFADGALVSFEVDEVDPGAEERWSVLVGARIRAEPDVATAPRPDAGDVVEGHDELSLCLAPVEVTGRREVGRVARPGS